MASSLWTTGEGSMLYNTMNYNRSPPHTRFSKSTNSVNNQTSPALMPSTNQIQVQTSSSNTPVNTRPYRQAKILTNEQPISYSLNSPYLNHGTAVGIRQGISKFKLNQLSKDSDNRSMVNNLRWSNQPDVSNIPFQNIPLSATEQQHADSCDVMVFNDASFSCSLNESASVRMLKDFKSSSEVSDSFVLTSTMLYPPLSVPSRKYAQRRVTSVMKGNLDTNTDMSQCSDIDGLSMDLLYGTLSHHENTRLAMDDEDLDSDIEQPDGNSLGMILEDTDMNITNNISIDVDTLGSRPPCIGQESDDTLPQPTSGPSKINRSNWKRRSSYYRHARQARNKNICKRNRKSVTEIITVEQEQKHEEFPIYSEINDPIYSNIHEIGISQVNDTPARRDNNKNTITINNFQENQRNINRRIRNVTVSSDTSAFMSKPICALAVTNKKRKRFTKDNQSKPKNSDSLQNFISKDRKKSLISKLKKIGQQIHQKCSSSSLQTLAVL